MKRVLSYLLIAVFIIGIICVSTNAIENEPSRIINVVYDDSRSMYLNNETRWCQAKYAMEVFCAMMGKDDTMNIYAMNRSEILTISGSDPDRIAKVHGMTSSYSGTPFSTLTKAGNAIRSEDSSYERWLVVLTDGSFDNTTQATVQSTLDGYNAAGIKTVYLAIGNDAVKLSGDPGAGAYAEKAASTGEILSKVTNIANQIFEHQVLSEAFVTEAGADTYLNIDIPTDQIVVFAQGEGATVGTLSLNGNAISPTSSFNVRHSGDVMPLNAKSDGNGHYYDPGYGNADIVVDTSLHGVVVTYDAGDTPFESGQFSINVSNATTVEYYYRPGVTVNCELQLNGKEVQANDKLYAGDYKVVLNFINPFTGKVIESELLSSAIFTLSVTNNDSNQEVSDKTSSITLVEGNVDINAIAELPGNVFLESNRSYTVLPKPINLNLEINPSKVEITPDQLGENSAPIILKVTNEETGQSLSENEYNQTTVLAHEFDGIAWAISKGKEISTWELHPISKDGTLESIAPGDFDITISASYEIDRQTAYGANSLKFSVGEYVGNSLDVKISPPSGTYDLNAMANPEAMIVSVMYEDPQTGKLLPLTEEMWNDFTIRAVSDSKMSWTINKGREVGTWTLTPGYYLGDPLLTDSGRIEVIVEVEGTSDIYSFKGSESQQADFEKLSLTNLLKTLAPRILAAIFIIWLLIGYIKKKRLRTRGLDPRCRFKGTTSPKQKISKDLFSVVLPYVPEKATVRCHKSTFQCNFPDLRIQATGRRSFKVINKSMPLKTTKICGEFYSDMDTLKKRNFPLAGFDITSVDPKTKKSLGTFSFK